MAFSYPACETKLRRLQERLGKHRRYPSRNAETKI